MFCCTCPAHGLGVQSFAGFWLVRCLTSCGHQSGLEFVTVRGDVRVDAIPFIHFTSLGLLCERPMVGVRNELFGCSGFSISGSRRFSHDHSTASSGHVPCTACLLPQFLVLPKSDNPMLYLYFVFLRKTSSRSCEREHLCICKNP